METSRSRGYMLTINNPDESDLKVLKLIKENDYCIYQFERGEEGTLHIQMMLYFKNAIQFKTVKKACPRAHIEKCINIQKSIEYCSKEDTRVEGPIEINKENRPNQGKRSDLNDIYDKIKKGMSTLSIADEYPSQYMRYYKAFDRVRELHMVDRTEMPEITWIWGETGVGKSHYVFSKHDINDIYVKDNTKWWDGYTQQKAIVFNDFDKYSWKIKDLLNILDKWPYRCEIKGGYIKLNSPYIYITCDEAPDKIYEGKDRNQLLRRIKHIIELKRE